MKSLMKVVAAVAVVCGFACSALASWTYDSGANTLSDDSGWVINTAVIAEPEGIQLSSVKTVGSATELDFRPSNMEGDVPAIVKAGDGLFKNRTTITKVWLPETLTVVPREMFSGAKGLLEAHLSSQTTSVGYQAFCYDNALQLVEPFLPETLTYLGSQSFYQCYALGGDLTLGRDGGDPLKIDGSQNFISCKRITGVTFGDNVTTVPGEMFNGGEYIEFVVLSTNTTTIGALAFLNCSRIKSVTPFLPPSVTSIGKQAFDGCTHLAGALTIGGSGTATSLGGYAFRSCKLVTALTIGAEVTSIPEYCFQSMTSLAEVDWHDDIATLGSFAFQGCSALTTMRPSPAPANLTKTGGDQVFYQCSKLTGEVAFGMNGSVTLSGAHLYRQTRISKITFGPGVTSVPSYFCSDNPSLVEIVFDPSVVTISGYAFQNCGGLTEVHLPPTLTTLGEFAFQGCANLTKVEPFLPAGITKLGTQAFYNSGKLTGDLYFATNGAPATIGAYAVSITSINRAFLGDGVTSIADHAFYKDGSLTYVKLPANLATLGANAFESCGKLTTVEPLLPKTLVGSLNSAFYLTALAGDLRIGSDSAEDSPVTFANVSFYSLKNLTSLTFGLNVPTIGTDQTFRYDTGIKTVYFLGDTTWNANEFRDWGNYQARLIVDKDSAYWNDFVADADKCRAPTPEEIVSYRTAYPGEPDPRAVTLINPKNQWIVSYGIVSPGEKNVTVSAKPQLYRPDDVTPAYGLYENWGEHLPMTLKSPRYVEDGLVLLECRGYEIETPTVTGWGHGVTTPLSGDGERVVSYGPEEDGSYRFSWLWEPVGYQVSFSLPSDSSIGTVTCSDPGLEGYYAAGTTATITAVPGTDVRFIRWHGDVPAGQETSPTITVTMNGPKTFQPEFESPWIYDTAAKTLSDGFWVLNASGSMDAITVGSAKVNYDLGLLNLAKPVKDGGVITAIGGEAFRSNTNIREVRLPETLKTIGRWAFIWCSSLTNVVPCLPASVTSIGENAFYECKALASPVRLGFGPEPLTFSSSQQFIRCTSIPDAQIGPGVTALPTSLFDECSSLTNATLPEGLVTVGANAFRKCGKLPTVTPFLPASVTSVGDQAFLSCGSLKQTVYFGTNDAEVAFSGGYQFQDAAVTGAVFGVGVKTIPNYCFNRGKIEFIDMPGAVRINNEAFHDCKSLRKVNMPAMENIGYGALWACSALETVLPAIVPPGVTNIGYAAFYEDSKLTGCLTLEAKKKRDIVFPSNIQFVRTPITEIVVGRYQTTLTSEMFDGCTSVRKLYFKGKPTYQSNTFKNWGARQAIVYLPKDNAEWMAIFDDPELFTPWENLNRDITDTYLDRFPDETPPLGLLSSKANPANQWVKKWNPNPTGTRIVFR